MTIVHISAAATALFILHTGFALAQETSTQTLITNVNVFNGVDEALIENASVLIEGNLIKSISPETIEAGVSSPA